MSTSDSKTDPRPGTSTVDPAKPAKGDAEPAWPPREAAPPEEAEAAKSTKPEPDAPEPAAALPAEEMPFSPSTLHWLEDGDVSAPVRPTGTGPVTVPTFDPTAPVAGRRRAVLVVGGATIVALIVSGALYWHSQREKASQATSVAAVDPARDLTNRAEAAFAANQINQALELAHLALVADPGFADAHYLVAKCEQSRKQLLTAREHFRKYLELAPLGAHAGEARAALAAMQL
jgi:tetratricopeptide (TPR) repeat protein